MLIFRTILLLGTLFGLARLGLADCDGIPDGGEGGDTVSSTCGGEVLGEKCAIYCSAPGRHGAAVVTCSGSSTGKYYRGDSPNCTDVPALRVESTTWERNSLQPVYYDHPSAVMNGFRVSLLRVSPNGAASFAYEVAYEASENPSSPENVRVSCRYLEGSYVAYTGMDGVGATSEVVTIPAASPTCAIQYPNSVEGWSFSGDLESDVPLEQPLKISHSPWEGGSKLNIRVYEVPEDFSHGSQYTDVDPSYFRSSDGPKSYFLASVDAEAAASGTIELTSIKTDLPAGTYVLNIKSAFCNACDGIYSERFRAGASTVSVHMSCLILIVAITFWLA